ncbi:unnamed protein product [Closterium sp. Naga37s-1]|nr:unnamed protein product [Closterium sp. Naga37s-1]
MCHVRYARGGRGMCHGCRTGVVHRDVKPANLVVDEGERHLCLIDLGACVDLRSGRNYVPSETVMDPKYAAPERFVMPPATTPHLPPDPLASLLSPFLWVANSPDRFDVFSAGVVLMQLSLKSLRHEANLEGFNNELKRCDYDLSKWRKKFRPSNADMALLDAHGGAAFDLAQQLLQKRPNHDHAVWPSVFGMGRPSAARALRHRFFSLHPPQPFRLPRSPPSATPSSAPATAAPAAAAPATAPSAATRRSMAAPPAAPAAGLAAAGRAGKGERAERAERGEHGEKGEKLQVGEDARGRHKDVGRKKGLAAVEVAAGGAKAGERSDGVRGRGEAGWARADVRGGKEAAAPGGGAKEGSEVGKGLLVHALKSVVPPPTAHHPQPSLHAPTAGGAKARRAASGDKAGHVAGRGDAEGAEGESSRGRGAGVRGRGDRGRAGSRPVDVARAVKRGHVATAYVLGSLVAGLARSLDDDKSRGGGGEGGGDAGMRRGVGGSEAEADEGKEATGGGGKEERDGGKGEVEGRKDGMEREAGRVVRGGPERSGVRAGGDGAGVQMGKGKTVEAGGRGRDGGSEGGVGVSVAVGMAEVGVAAAGATATAVMAIASSVWRGMATPSHAPPAPTARSSPVTAVVEASAVGSGRRGKERKEQERMLQEAVEAAAEERERILRGVGEREGGRQHEGSPVELHAVVGGGEIGAYVGGVGVVAREGRMRRQVERQVIAEELLTSVGELGVQLGSLEESLQAGRHMAAEQQHLLTRVSAVRATFQRAKATN